MTTITARPVLLLHEAPGGPDPIVEGPAFDRSDNLFFVSVHGDRDGNKIFSVSLSEGVVTPVFGDETSAPTGIAIHRNGDLYVADLGLNVGEGRVLRMKPDGSEVETLVDSFDGRPVYPDDLVFDSRGCLYFNDMQGNVGSPDGKILSMSPTGEVELIAERLVAPNGIAFTPDRRVLWVSEHKANRLLTLDISEDGRLDHGALPGAGICVRTNLSGGEVDSLTIDSEGNVYAAMFMGGRVDVVDRQGAPIATIVPEGGSQLYPTTTHVVIRPGTTTGYLVAASSERAMLFEFEALAPADLLYSHE